LRNTLAAAIRKPGWGKGFGRVKMFHAKQLAWCIQKSRFPEQLITGIINN
jgi:hypothetical protein